MHIPDGYLSPSTCLSLFGAATPFWYAALKRVQRMLNSRMIPLLSVFAAFSFVIMMFNLPLPGGTTGHAVGMGIASIVLGPWASIVAISVALTIQSVFFGDGGITAIGANCFNMAIVGSLAAYGAYRILARGSAIESRRRVLAAGIAGYIAINLSALCAAIEFGLQPVFFHDSTGAPLYAPYSLSISIPAMLIGHLSFAGLAELVITSGLVAWLQRADPELLRLTAPDASQRKWRHTTRKLWLVVGVLLVLTPLGILAVGSAWGEWSPQDLAGAHLRVPQGLEKLSSLWSAPLARYSPSFVRNASFGYLLSAIVGVGIIVLLGILLRSLNRRESFIERTVRALLRVLRDALFAEETAQAPGLLQSLDARVKLAGLLTLIFTAIALHRLSILAGLFAVAFILAAVSKITLRVLAIKIWIAVFAFTGAIALPAIFLTSGTTVFVVPVLHWAASYQGIRAAAFLILRAETAATFGALLILCTLWTRFLRALHWFRVPAVLVAIAGMTYRYVFLLVQIAEDMFEAREARLIGTLEPAERRRLAAAGAGLLLGRSIELSGDVHLAMQARGFRGHIRLLDEPTIRPKDWLGLAAFACVACLAVWFGR